MSRLEELIEELCPNGVEYYPLEEVATIKARIGWQGLTKKEYLAEGEYYLVTGVDFENGKIAWDYCHFVTKERYTQDANIQLKNGDVLVTKDGTLGKVAFVENMTKPATLNSGVFVIRPIKNTLDSRFLYHYLNSPFLMKFAQGQLTGGTIKHLNQGVIVRLPFPVPPLEVQREIVRVLDFFTLLTAELTAELTARQKQYGYYRNKLLSFDTKVASVVELRSVVKKSCSGATPAKGNSNYYEGGTIPWLRTQDVRFNEIYQVDSYITELAVAETGVKWISENCVIVAISGATAGRCAINKFRTTTNQHCLNLEIDADKASYKYIFYCISNKFDELIAKKQGARGDLNSSLVLGLRIPLPSLEIQNKIVNILDNFDAICSDLNIGLPAEIEARHKQYEYYRDKLLTFKELSE